MALRLCAGDPVLDALRNTFKATPLRIPERRFTPGSVVVEQDGEPVWLGPILDLLSASDAGGIEFTIHTSDMPDLTNTRTRKVKADVGFQVLDGFLSGFSVSPVGITAAIKNAETVSFRFQEVKRVYVAPSSLGRMLAGKHLDTGNKITDDFVHGRRNAYVVDSVIQSSNFSMSVNGSSTQSASIDVDLISGVLAKAKGAVEVERGDASEITFRGSDPLTFAFTCLRMRFDSNGALTTMRPAARVRSRLAVPDESSPAVAESEWEVGASKIFGESDALVDLHRVSTPGFTESL